MLLGFTVNTYNNFVERVKESVKKSAKGLASSMPAMTGIILLIGLIINLLSEETIKSVFSGHEFIDGLAGSVVGSVAAGNPITSYIVSGELLKSGISLFAITAFLVAWVTVGIVQLPAEAAMLGKKFAIARNILAFVFSLIVAGITCLIVGLL